MAPHDEVTFDVQRVSGTRGSAFERVLVMFYYPEWSPGKRRNTASTAYSHRIRRALVGHLGPLH
jgi:hypothetical protein